MLPVASKIYGLDVSARNAYYDKYGSPIKLDYPVISVGNLSVGGTGKTPFVQMLTKYFQSKFLSPIIIGRGYKKQKKGIVEVSDGNRLLSNAEEGGDEMILLAHNLKIPVIAGEKKWETALFACKKYHPDLVIIDDAFQHRKLHRDIDIVIIDKETLEKPNLLPSGRLREPIKSLKRADIVVLAGTTNLDSGTKQHIRDDAVIIRVTTIEANPYNYVSGHFYKYHELAEPLKGVVAFAGIAKPNRFFDMISYTGYEIMDRIEYTDHYNYTKDDVVKLIEIAKNNDVRFLATTEKDAVKFVKFKGMFVENKIELLVFPIILTIVEGQKEFFIYLNKFMKMKGIL